MMEQGVKEVNKKSERMQTCSDFLNTFISAFQKEEA
jgi:hypothetical protein